MAKPAKSLPVVMHHYVSRYPGLSASPERFEEYCRITAENGWRGVGLEEAENFLLGQGSLPAKSFLFTFDDGYLDNYIYAWPILKKYGHKGVVFAVADSVSAVKNAAPRRTLEDVWAGKIAESALDDVHSPMQQDALGHASRIDKFFSWEEARVMEKSGVMAVAGHSMRHEGVFTGPEHDGFRQPGPRVIALPKDNVSGAFWGCPNFSCGPELSSLAFIPNPEMVRAIKELVPQDDAGAADFFKNEAGVGELAALVGSYRGKTGRYESDAEQAARMLGVIKANQDLLQKELGRKSKSFCWPWGSKNDVALNAAKEAGFEVFYNVGRGVNLPGNALEVKRFRAGRKPGDWFLKRLKIYASPLLGKLYASMRI